MSELKRAIPATDAACQNLADDLLRGADEIAEFVFGSAKQRRKVYYLATQAKTQRLPVFRIGSILCARKSKVLEWIAKQEER